MFDVVDPQAGDSPLPPTQGADGGDYQQPAKAAPTAAEKLKIENEVKALLKEYNEARVFDEAGRRQFAKDRRYASGTADLSWAVSANLIGSFIDILCSTLYARNPDVSCRKPMQVIEDHTEKMEAFAKTVEIVVSRLWQNGNMKKAARKAIRSVLSVGQGWLKVLLLTEKHPQPETTAALNDAMSLFARLSSQEAMLNDDGSAMSDEERDNKKAECERIKQAMEDKIEATVRKLLTIDFVPAQDMQVSLDVAQTDDYLDANWVANHLYVPTDSLRETCPEIPEEDIKSAKKFYQRKADADEKSSNEAILLPIEKVTAESAESYVSSAQGGEQTRSFAKIIEFWDRRDAHIKTVVEGVKCWAKAPYEPNYKTSRFYPYFRFSFYECDGERQPQSLAFRLHKLQDEYCCTRSNQRLARERSLPGTVFNATQLTPEDAAKLSSSASQELIGLKPVDPATPMQNLIAQKTVGTYDPRLYDVGPILADMDRISGVQQAMQQAAASAQPKTATEANIEQAGANSRTGTDRDLVETALSEIALYTTQCALQVLTIPDVQRMAGAGAFWPAGMDTDDLVTLVEVNIEAGTTGKPKSAGDQAAWIQALPVIKQVIQESQMALQSGNKPLFDALSAVLQETLTRIGDTTDIERFIPQQPPEKPIGPPPPKVSVTLKGDISPEAAAMIAGLPPPGQGGPPVAQPEGGAGAGPPGHDLSSNPAVTHNPALTIHQAAPEHHVDNSVHLHIKPPEKSK